MTLSGSTPDAQRAPEGVAATFAAFHRRSPSFLRTARQVGVLAAEWLQYEWQGRSIEYHRAQIRSLLGFREASVEDGEALAAWLSEHVLNQDRQMDRLKATLMERCRARFLGLPIPRELIVNNLHKLSLENR